MLLRIKPASATASLALTLALSAGLLVETGCGSSSSPNAAANPGATPASAAAPNVTEATNVVAQFLDAIRRGGETGGANQMLTQHAQTVLQRLGRTVQPIGSPDAVFTVTRAEAVEGIPGAALVHSTWTEPVAEGKTESYQVVWALEHETAGWRISGLAMDLQPGQEPMIVDFENATQMASLLNGEENPVAANPAGGDAVSQAPAAGGAVQR
jgi:uncharacterized protein YbjQ (UPF0145 family)